MSLDKRFAEGKNTIDSQIIRNVGEVSLEMFFYYIYILFFETSMIPLPILRVFCLKYNEINIPLTNYKF